jgi:DNA-binding MarR family transcriptional regulator
MPTQTRTRKSTPIDQALAETPKGHLQELDLRQLIGYQVAQASIVTLSVFDEVVGRPLGLRTVEYTVLALIRANGAVQPAVLANALNLSPSYITLALAKLEGMGLVKRKTNTEDKRSQRLHVTPRGDVLAARMTQDLIAAERAAFVTLTPVEQAMLGELLHKLGLSRARANRR